MRYEDFVIQVTEGATGSFRTTVLESPAGQAVGSFIVPLEAAAARGATNLGSDRTARGAPPTLVRHLIPEDATPHRKHTNRDVGEALFRSLFSGPVRSLYDQSLGGLRNQPGRGLRIKLKFDTSSPAVAKLQGLPWELMRRAETAEYLGLSRLSPVVRFLDVPRPPAALPFRPPLRILVLIASPDGLEALNLEEEKGQIERAWGNRSAVEVSFVERAAPEALRRALLDRDIHVLHFMGHGGFEEATGEGVLYFVDDHGGALPVRGSTLTTKLCDIRSLRLVVLNACETARVGAEGDSPFAGVASALVRGGMPAVVAMRKRISDVAALAFSEAFYARLAGGDPIDAALTEGRQAIHSATPDSVEWSTPILYLRVADGVLFRAPERAQISEVSATPVPGGAVSGEAGVSESSLPRLWVRGAALMMAIATLIWLVVDRWPGRRDPSGVTSGTTAEKPADVASTDARTATAPAIQEPAERAPRRTEAVPPRPQPQAAMPPPVIQAAAHQAAQGPRSPFPSGDSVLPKTIGFETSVPGLRGLLREVSVLDDGRLAWLLVLHNEGAGRSVDIGLDLGRTYLADANGYRYAVERSDAGAIDGAVDDVLAAGDTRAYWLVFGVPLGRATTFTAFFHPPGSTEARYAPFRVTLAPQAAARARAEPEMAVPADAVRIEIAIQQLPTRGTNGIEARIAAVHLLPADPASGRLSGRMRWHVTLLNSSLETETAGLTLPAVYLEDEFGHVYPVMASSAGKHPYGGRYLEKLEGGLRQDLWLEFNAPRPGVQALRVRLAGYDPQAFDIDSFRVDLPPIAANLRYQPKVLPVIAESAGQLTASLDGLQGRLVEVERLSNGRLRWQVELRNESDSTLEVGFDYRQINLSDGKRTYELLASDSGLHTDQIYTERLQPGGRVFHWLDFTEPNRAAREFRLSLASHDGSYHYVPLRVDVDPRAFLGDGE